ncbi:MAG: PDDEXK nuclease domain-containing protein [Candidatus Algichlamydia australiensis]|nr:PDDEXK nuclease domain-containing protein [Chlamydiales bacterium]
MHQELLSKSVGSNLELLEDLREMIDSTKKAITFSTNSSLILLFWRVGLRINNEILKGKRAKYGENIITSLSCQLTTEFGNSFTVKNLRRMMQFAQIFPCKEIVVSLTRQLSWTHFTVLIPIKDQMKREFYAQMCRIEGWSVRILRKKINSLLFERTAISKKSELIAKKELHELQNENKLSQSLVFQNPYVLEFLNLNDRYLERDLEDAIMRELEMFLLELGSGFCFLARQKRIIIDNEDFHIDLLFFHRDLNRLVVIDLKLGDFKAEHKGQMELYLRWLDKHERRTGENPPIGLILCAGKKEEQIELLELSSSGIHVAEYVTVLPPKEILQERLHKAIQQAQSRIGNGPDYTL